MTEIEKETLCTACDGKGYNLVPYSGNTRISPPSRVNCRYCYSTGSRKHQLFNWMRQPDGYKYIIKQIDRVSKKMRW